VSVSLCVSVSVRLCPDNNEVALDVHIRHDGLRGPYGG